MRENRRRWRQVIGLVVLSARALASTGGNGEGFNGPDLSGRSVPVTVDRAVPLAELDRVVTTCGNRLSRALVRQLSRGNEVEIVEQQPGETVGYTTRENAPDGTVTDTRYLRYDNRWTLKEPNGKGSWEYTFSVDASDLAMEVYVAMGNGLDIHADPFHVDTKEGGFFRLVGTLPVFRFTVVPQDPTYDEFGRLVASSGQVATDLRILLPAQHSASVALKNKYTKTPSKLTFNSVAYADCLQAELGH